jgi:hypothetical protein
MGILDNYIFETSPYLSEKSDIRSVESGENLIFLNLSSSSNSSLSKELSCLIFDHNKLSRNPDFLG